MKTSKVTFQGDFKKALVENEHVETVSNAVEIFFWLFLIPEFPASLVFIKKCVLLERKGHSFTNGWKTCDIIREHASSWPMPMLTKNFTF